MGAREAFQDPAAESERQRTIRCSRVCEGRFSTKQVNRANRLILIVNTDTARDQRVDRVALFIFAVARRRVSLVVDCFSVA